LHYLLSYHTSTASLYTPSLHDALPIFERICHQAGATSFRLATTVGERELLWKGRKMALASMGRLAPNYYLHDTVVPRTKLTQTRSEEHTSELQSRFDLVCRLLLEKKKI